jgi:hypothetical protein
MIYRPRYVINDFHGRHSNNREEVSFEVGVFDNFQDLVEVCSKIDHSNAYIPPNLSSKYGFWGTSFDKRDPTSRDSMYMVTKDEALMIMTMGPRQHVHEEETPRDFMEAEAKERMELERDLDAENYEAFLEDIENRLMGGDLTSWL